MSILLLSFRKNNILFTNSSINFGQNTIISFHSSGIILKFFCGRALTKLSDLLKISRAKLGETFNTSK